MANSWLLNRLREINEQSKSWPAWVFEQPLTRRDAEKIARGERLRSPAPMASDDVLERATKAQKMVARVIDVFEQAVFIGSVVDDLAVEVRELRGRLALFEELCGYMRGPIEVARKSLPLRVAGEPRNVDIHWHTSEDSLDLFDDAMGGEG